MPSFHVLEALKLNPKQEFSDELVRPALSAFRLPALGCSPATPPAPFLRGGFFMQQQQQQGNAAPAAPRPVDLDRMRVHKIEGDGRCMFRATVRSLATNKGQYLRKNEELQEAELLRQACYDALCRTSQRLRQFPDARKQIIYGYGELKSYCNNLAKPSFWGGEVEIMVITRMLKVPIFVYQSKEELTNGQEHGFQELIKFGEKYAKRGRSHKPRKPVRLLYTGGNHYDLLLA